jgi:RNA polymerase sigma-70 factor (ECF subfamily)
MLAVEELRHTDSCSIFSARCSSTSEYNDICNAVNRLPDGRRETMRLLIHGHKYNEIAFVMDIPIGTVKSRINCSRIILKEVLKDYMA